MAGRGYRTPGLESLVGGLSSYSLSPVASCAIYAHVMVFYFPDWADLVRRTPSLPWGGGGRH